MKAPRCWIEIYNPDTQEPVAVRWTDILDVSVENTLYLAADSFEIVLRNDQLLSDWLRKEQEVRIWLGYVKNASEWGKSELTHIFTGKIDGVRPNFNMQMTVQLLGRDYSAPLLDSEFNLAFAERTSSQIAQILAEKRGLTPKITDTEVIIEKDLYQDKKEWEVLQALADREGFVCYVTKEKELYFGPRSDDDETVVAELKYRQKEKSNLISINFDDSMVGVINKVVVRHWVGKHKRLVEAEDHNQDLIDKYGEKVRIVYDSKAKTDELAKAQATKRLKEWSRAVVTADEVRIVGDPAISAEKMVDIEGCGRFDGKYYIDRVRHVYQKSEGYLCELNITSQRPDSAAQYRQDLYDNHEKTA